MHDQFPPLSGLDYCVFSRVACTWFFRSSFSFSVFLSLCCCCCDYFILFVFVEMFAVEFLLHYHLVFFIQFCVFFFFPSESLLTSYFVKACRSEYSFACCACLQGFCLPRLGLPGSFNFIFSKCFQSSTVECVLNIESEVSLAVGIQVVFPWYDPSRLTGQK